MANIKVSEMTEATTFEDGDYTMIVQANQSKKISKENIFNDLEDEISSNTNDISTINDNIGTMANLKTQITTDLVSGINSIIDADIYSTTEVKTNKIWIDNKPIYRKVINFGTLPNTTDKLVDPNIVDLERIVTMKGLAYNVADGNTFPLPNVTTGGSQYTIDIAIINKQIRIRTATDRTSMTAYITLEYTKTSD